MFRNEEKTRKLVKHLITILVLCCSTQVGVWAQTISFEADTIKNILRKPKLPKHFTAQFWLIQGDTFRYGMSPQKYVRPKKKKQELDTIFYQRNRQKKLDSIFFKIKKNGVYQFRYNACCGGFYVRNLKTKKYTSPKFIVQLKNAKANSNYLITLGDSGVLWNTKDTLRSECQSAMAPNIVQLSIVEIDKCGSDKEECRNICLIKNGVVDDSYNFEYKPKQILTKFKFMALQNKPYKLQYDIKQNKILKLK